MIVDDGRLIKMYTVYYHSKQTVQESREAMHALNGIYGINKRMDIRRQRKMLENCRNYNTGIWSIKEPVKRLLNATEMDIWKGFKKRQGHE